MSSARPVDRPAAGAAPGTAIGRGLLLAVDTATSVAVVALGETDGRPVAVDAWPAGQRHSEELLPRVAALLEGSGAAPGDVAGVIVGTGPGAFTGLRVGLATAKTLAHQLGVPVVGVSSGEALLAAAGAPDGLLLLPAGASDRVEVTAGSPARLASGAQPPAPAPGQAVVAVDLAGRAEAEAASLGRAAQAGLGVALLALGAARIAAGVADDPRRLVPEYVTLPRGVPRSGGEIEWSRDHR